MLLITYSHMPLHDFVDRAKGQVLDQASHDLVYNMLGGDITVQYMGTTCLLMADQRVIVGHLFGNKQFILFVLSKRLE